MRDAGRGRIHTGSTAYATQTDADRALTLVEAQMISGEWTDPDRGEVLLGEHALTWIEVRPGLRLKTVELYTRLLERHIVLGLGEVPVGKLTTALVRSWRAALIDEGVSVSTAAKACRLLRVVGYGGAYHSWRSVEQRHPVSDMERRSQRRT
ncbi:hypothetical protein [Microbispora sp. NPDC049633]|uniref:hypothetical protein n=1 Tax=Microbispora sp. NPDC049633 TaxID=3154355 RepID=UPI00342661FF